MRRAAASYLHICSGNKGIGAAKQCLGFGVMCATDAFFYFE
jgi:hypothetical protein